jgi:hypothetical protein
VSQAERLACMGPGTITVGPVQVVPARDDTTAGTPAWLAGAATRYLALLLPDGTETGSVPVRIDPASGVVVPPNTWVYVQVHVDDPAAVGCTRTAVFNDLPVGDATDQILWCRQQLVLTGYTPAPSVTAAP